MAALPIRTAPASFSRLITCASLSMTCFANGRAPHVVGAPVAESRSFAAYGMPCSVPRQLPAAMSFSACRASRNARSRMSVTYALSRAPMVSLRCRYASVNSTGESLRVRMRSASSVAVR
jgi:hypothetical protein